MTSSDPRLFRSTGACAAVLALVLGATACSAPSPALSVGSGKSAPATPATAAAAPQHEGSPSGLSAPVRAAAVRAALEKLIGSAPRANRDQIRESLAAAGFPPATVEITATRTPTGLAADAVEVGVVDDRACVMAQIRSGAVETSVLPVLPHGRCFVGSDQR